MRTNYLKHSRVAPEIIYSQASYHCEKSNFFFKAIRPYLSRENSFLNENNELDHLSSKDISVKSSPTTTAPLSSGLQTPVNRFATPTSFREKLKQNELPINELFPPNTQFAESLFKSDSHLIQQLTQLINDVMADHAGCNAVDDYPPTNFCYINKTSISDLIPLLVKYVSYVEKNIRNYEESIFILMLIYIDTWLSRKTDYLHIDNINQLVFISMLVASKFIEDQPESNYHMAEFSGIPLSEINEMELAFLNDIQYSLNVTPELYQEYYNGVLVYKTAPVVEVSEHTLCAPSATSICSYFN